MTSPISSVGGFSGIEGISGLGGFGALSGLGELSGTGQTTGGTAAPTGSSVDFAGMLAQGLATVQANQTKASELAVKVADGTLRDPAEYTMASTEAALGLQLTMAIRNKAVEAFQEIMRMQA